MFERFGTILVTISQMDASVAFYRDVMGLRLVAETPMWSQFDVGGVSLGLHAESQNLKVSPHSGVILGFDVADIESTRAALQARGGKVSPVSDEAFGRLAEIRDPDGYVIQIVQRFYEQRSNRRDQEK